MSRAIIDVMTERQRQIDEEGYDLERDKRYVLGELSMGAVAYVVQSEWLWPWPADCFKPKDRRRDLVRAAAMIIADIERMDRAQAPAPVGEQAGPRMTATEIGRLLDGEEGGASS